MAGNKIGGQKAAAKNRANDPDFYAKIGAKGGKNGRTGGFASNVVGEDGLTGAQRARIAGARGGRISRRKKDTNAVAAQPVVVQSNLDLAA